MQFSYVNRTAIHFGEGQIAQLATAIPAGSRILMLYGGGSIKKNGIFDQVSQALGEFEWFEFGGIKPNPDVKDLDKAVEFVKTKQVNFILAVGGGSVIDGAKYIAAAAEFDGAGWDILAKRHKILKATRMGVILTIPATGSESNSAAVISNLETQDKLSFQSPCVQPEFAILDPSVITSLPEKQIANGLVDAFVHVCEQYLTHPTTCMVQEAYAESLLCIILRLGEKIFLKDGDWHANFMWAANQALNGLVGAGMPQDWSTHIIGHELTALYGVDHARSLAIVQPALLRHQIEVKRSKLQQMGRNVFGFTDSKGANSEDLAERTIDAIEDFYHRLGVATKLTEHRSTKAEAIAEISAQLKRHGMARLGENQGITIKHCREILESAIS